MASISNFTCLGNTNRIPLCTSPLLARSKFKRESLFLRFPLTQFPKFCPILHSDKLKQRMIVYSSVQPGSPPPTPNHSPGSWMGWILGLMVSVVLPFLRNKGIPSLNFKEKAETVREKIEEAADFVGDVAEKVDKVAEEIEEHLPEGAKLKRFLDVVEDVAEDTAKRANIVEEAFDKLEHLDDKEESTVDKAESIVEPVHNEAKETAKK